MKKIFLDFDGTIVEHQYPKLGRFVPHALQVVEKLQNAGHEIILNTYRADCNDGTLEIAIGYLKSNQFVWREEVGEIVPNRVLKEKSHPWKYDPEFKHEFIYLDDQALDTPLIPAVMSNGKMVDWHKVESDLIAAGIL